MNKFILTAVSSVFAFGGAQAQQGNSLTAKDYEHAESMLSYNTEPFVDHEVVRPNWLPGDKFWYRVLTAQGSEFILVDPAKKSRLPAFDQQKLAASLSTATGKHYDADMLPFESFSFLPGDQSILFSADDKQWKCDLQTYQCTEDTTGTR